MKNRGGNREFGGDDVYDVIKLIDIMLELNFVKKDGVYMLGQSRGGMMTYRACSIDRRIKATVEMVQQENLLKKWYQVEL